MEGVILQEVLRKGITIKSSDPLLKARYNIKMIVFPEDIFPFHILAHNKILKDFLNEK